jgi:hypothetical protein
VPVRARATHASLTGIEVGFTRSIDEFVEVLRLKAALRFTPPGAGSDATSPTCWYMAWTSAGHSG